MKISWPRVIGATLMVVPTLILLIVPAVIAGPCFEEQWDACRNAKSLNEVFTTIGFALLIPWLIGMVMGMMFYFGED